MISLYDAYEKSGDTLQDMFGSYTPPIRAKKHTCVGLGLELLKRWRWLDKEFPGFAAAASLLSCEEAVTDVRGYVSGGGGGTKGAGAGPDARAEKEHVLVGVGVTVDGRGGLLLADPGYHVPRVVTVMADHAYPHTGWFTQSEEGGSAKQYGYEWCALGGGYVEWRERGGRPASAHAAPASRVSLVYAARPYLDAIAVTERRNLVYNFRSLLRRDQKGHLIAGIYFPVGGARDAQFTLFFDNGTEKRKTKYKFGAFLHQDRIPPSMLEEVELCNTQMSYKPGELLDIICKLAAILADQVFIEQMLTINDEICQLSI